MTQPAPHPSGSPQPPAGSARPLTVFLVGDDPELAAAILKQQGLHLVGQVPTLSLMLPLIRDCPAEVLLVTALSLEGWPADQAVSGLVTLNPRLKVALAGSEETDLPRPLQVDWLFSAPYQPARVAQALSSGARALPQKAVGVTSEALPGRLLRMFAPSPGKGPDSPATPGSLDEVTASAVPASPEASPREREEGASRSELPRVIAICGPKGGVGKTTLATSLAVSLAQAQPGSTVLLDLSLRSAEAGLHLDLLDGPTLVDALPYADEGNAALSPYLQEHRPSGLRVLLGPPRAELAELVSTSSALSLIQSLRAGHSFTVLDLGSGCGEDVMSFAAAADDIWLVTTLEPGALRQAYHGLEALRRWPGGPARRVRLIANRVGTGSSVPGYQVERFLGLPLAGEIPEDAAAVARALQQGNPAVMEGGALAQAVEALARQLGVDPGARPPGLSRWLRLGRR